MLKLYTIKKKRKETQESIAKLREEKEKTMGEKNKMENDLDYIEKIAMRKILGYKTTYIDREKTNAKIYKDVNDKIKEQGGKKEIVS